MSASRQIAFSNVDRVLWPEVGFTKRQMLDYYEALAGVIVPHLHGRPLTLGRFPEGVHGKGWYQTTCRGAPSWLEVAEVPASGRADKKLRMCVVNDGDSLLWVANQGTVELHPYLSAASALDEPLVLVVDLDPGEGAGLADCCRVALLVRDHFDVPEVAVKTSGSSGLHIFVGLTPGHTFERTRAYARELAAVLVTERPDDVTDSFRLAERRGRVLIDWRQNERSRSMIAPYSLRATPWPLVSTPLSWDAVAAVASSGDVRPLFFSPRDAIDRVAQLGDLFASALERSGRLPNRVDLTLNIESG